MICPICGYSDLSFVSEYHKNIKMRIFNYIVIFVLAFLSLGFLACVIESKKISGELKSFFFCFLSLFFVLKVRILFDESRTHVLAVCKNCGTIWNIN